MIDIVTAALGRLGLTGETAAAALEAITPPRKLGPGEPLANQGDDAVGLHLVLKGVLKSSRDLDNGLTQTLALFVPGEVAGVHAVALGRETSTVTAITAGYVATLPARRLARLRQGYPGVTEALWRAGARESAILQEWVIGMGRRTALSQIAHLLCEMVVRMRLAGMADGDAYGFPLTQVELADAVGLSPVHVNRILQTLRSTGLIALRHGRLQVGDWSRVAEVGDFDPSYLELRPSEGVSHAALLFPFGERGGTGDRRHRHPLPER